VAVSSSMMKVPQGEVQGGFGRDVSLLQTPGQAGKACLRVYGGGLQFDDDWCDFASVGIGPADHKLGKKCPFVIAGRGIRGRS
jgi:hypothetical protein